jgi:hypothetical protein
MRWCGLILNELRSLRQAIADRMKGCSPSERFEVLGEVVGGDEGGDVRLELPMRGVVEDTDRGIFDRAMHPFDLPIGPRVIGPRDLVCDSVHPAHAVEGMSADLRSHATPIARSVSKGDSPLSVRTVWIA